MNIYQFMGANPVLTVVLVMVVCDGLVFIVRAIRGN